MASIPVLCYVCCMFLIVYADSITEYEKESNVLKMNLRKRFLENGTEITVPFEIDKYSLKELNIDVKKVTSGVIEVGLDKSEQLFFPDGNHIDLDYKHKNIITKKESIQIQNLSSYLFLDITDMEGDPTLIPLNKQNIYNMKHKQHIHKCSKINMQMEVFSSSIKFYFNDQAILNVSFNRKWIEPNGQYYVENEGIYLVVFNAQTCRITFREYFPINDPGVYRYLEWMLQNIQPARLIVMTALHDGSIGLNKNLRHKFFAMGSTWSQTYLYRDIWALIYTKGGKTLLDVLLPNQGSSKESGSPFSLSYELIPAKNNEFCTSWPSSKDWILRRKYCRNMDGFNQLCDCSDPLVFESKVSNKVNISQTIPVTIMTSSGRGMMVNRLIEKLHINNVAKEDIVITMDGYEEIVHELSVILGLKFLIRRPEGIGGTRISRHLRFALFNMLKLFPLAPAFIVIEDDIDIAEDFYQLMNHMLPVFEMDRSVWCVSGFNLLSNDRSVADPSMIIRGSSCCSLGWMMPRNVIEEILPKWLPSSLYHNWDYFFLENDINKNRVSLVPEVLRSNHKPFTSGTHFTLNYKTEKYLNSRQLYKGNATGFIKMDSLIEPFYSNVTLSAIKSATTIDFSFIKYNLIEKNKENTYAVYVRNDSNTSMNTVRMLHYYLEKYPFLLLMVEDIEIVRFHRATVYIILSPSKYSVHMPINYKFFEASKKDIEDLDRQISYGVRASNPETHRKLWFERHEDAKYSKFDTEKVFL